MNHESWYPFDIRVVTLYPGDKMEKCRWVTLSSQFSPCSATPVSTTPDILRSNIFTITAPFQWRQSSDPRWENACESSEANLQGRGGESSCVLDALCTISAICIVHSLSHSFFWIADNHKIHQSFPVSHVMSNVKWQMVGDKCKKAKVKCQM